MIVVHPEAAALGLFHQPLTFRVILTNTHLNSEKSGEAEEIELVLTFFDDLVVVDPDVAVAGKHVNVRL